MNEPCLHRAARHSRTLAALLLPGLLGLTGCDSSLAEESPNIGSAASTLGADDAVLFGDPGTGPLSARPAAATLRPMSQEELQWLTAQKARIPSRITPPTPPRRALERTLAATRAMSPDRDVRVLVKLADPGFDFRQIGRGELERGEAISRRKEQLRPSQEALETELRRFGARELVRLWLGGNDVLATLPARFVEPLSRLPGVVDVELDEEGGSTTDSYTGNESRNGLLTDSLVAKGYDGNVQGRNGTTSPLRLGIIEHSSCKNPVTNWIARDHVGFLDVNGGVTRVKRVYNCSSGACGTTTSTGGSTHGSWVASIAAGNIEQGQDPNFPGPNNYPLNGTFSQQQRSGQAPESEIYYYGGICSYSSIRAAIEQSVADGVDIINMSFAYESNCDRTLDHGGTNAALANAMVAGVLNVAAAGNTSSSLSDACNLTWPGWRPDVLNVTGLNSNNSATPFRDLNIRIGSSAMGGMTVRTFTGVTSTVAGLGLAAPATYNLLYASAPNSYTGDGLSGTSFASPTVAGAAADLRHAFNALGFPSGSTSGYMLMTMMFAMGDGWNGQNVTTPGGSVFLRTGVSRISGYGRPRVRFPSSDSLTGPWGWGWRAVPIYDKQTLTYPVWDSSPESSLLTEWKFALTWPESNLDSIADIDISVWNTCPAGGGSPVLVASQTDYDYRNRIRLTTPEISGRCLEMRVYGFNVPPEGRVVYMTDFFHSGNPNP